MLVVLAVLVFAEILACVAKVPNAAVLAVKMDTRMIDWSFIVGSRCVAK
jgi:hypothetical protein